MQMDDLRDYVRQESRVRNRVLRAELVAEHPYCHWCGILVNNSYSHFTRKLERGETYPDDMATIDHLYDRLDPENRYKIYPDGENKVLACYKCNKARADERTNQLPREVRRLRMQLGQKRRANGDRTPRPFVFGDLNLNQNYEGA